MATLAERIVKALAKRQPTYGTLDEIAADKAAIIKSVLDAEKVRAWECVKCGGTLVALIRRGGE